jgi:hypothetical protein
MEEFIGSVLKRIDNIKRLRPETQHILLTKYSKQTGVPRNLLEAYMKGDTDTLMSEFTKLKDQGQITNQDLTENIRSKEGNRILKREMKKVEDEESTDDSESEDEYIDPIKSKVDELRKGDMKRNVNDYIAKNRLFSKTERLVVLLDPVLKELLNTKESKMELKELVKLYAYNIE